MIRIYLIISLLVNLLFPAIMSSGAFATAPKMGEADVIVELSTPNDLKIGSKVLNNGLVVGKVSFVDNSKQNISRVSIDLQPSVKLPTGIIGLIKSPMTIDPVNRQTLLEFFAPIEQHSESLKKGSTIKGFCSFEEFWKADLGGLAASYETASLS